MSISNLSRLYLINCNLKSINKTLNDFNIFENIRFAEEIVALGIQINRMREILDDMRHEQIKTCETCSEGQPIGSEEETWCCDTERYVKKTGYCAWHHKIGEDGDNE